MTLREDALAALARVIDPELRRPITELGMVGEISEDRVEIKLTVATCPAAERIRQDAQDQVDNLGLRVDLAVMNQSERDQLKELLREGKPARVNPFEAGTLTEVLLIGSGKGGVGKSTITANLAVSLAARGLSVGLIDADIFGYSIPGQLGITDKPTKLDEMILPPVAFGVKVISIGMFVDGSQAIAWRGPMLHRTIEQFLKDVYWGDLDYLLIDMPPGTGDIAISLGQQLPTAKTVVITTPQVAASDVAVRSGLVGQQTGQSCLGVIENMSWLELPDGTRNELFGVGGGEEVAKALDAPLLGQIPLSSNLRQASDSGIPAVLQNEQDPAVTAIQGIVEKLVRGRSLKGKRIPLA